MFQKAFQATRNRFRDKRFSRGQAAIVATLAIPTLVGAIGLGTDLAILFYNWSVLQNAVDSAVLAGSTYLPSSPSLASTTASNYGQQNDLTANDSTSIALSNNNMAITMTASRAVPYYFARVFGFKSKTIAVTAMAQVQSVGAAAGLVPIGLDVHTDFTPYQQVTLIQGQSPGNWEPLAMGYSPSDDPGGNNYRNNIVNGYPGTVKIGDWIYTETGQLNGPTKQGFNTRLGSGQQSDPGGTPLTHTLTDPRVVELPIVSFANTNGKSQVPVYGFAVLWVVSVNANGTITGDFIDQVMSQNTPSTQAPTYGAFYPVLVQ
jgi:Flp pilus assembly protein TadG